MGWREHPEAPVAGSRLCGVDELVAESCREFKFGDGDAALSLLLFRGKSGIYAYVNMCPHFSLPLNSRPNRFLLLADETVMCAYHCAIFRMADGICVAGPAQGMGLTPVPIELRDTSVYLSHP